MRVPVQRLCRGRRRPPLGQQQHGVPALPLPGRGRQNHPALQVLHSQLPSLQRPLYLPDSHHPPITTRLSVPSLTLHCTLTICAFHLGFSLDLWFNIENPGDIATKATRDKLTLHIGSASLNLGAGTLQGNQREIKWTGTGLSWAAGDSVQVKITGPHSSPNAYGYRTIWNALMTVSVDSVSTYAGYSDNTNEGQMTNNTILPTRTDIGVIINEFRYPWNGYAIDILEVQGTKMRWTQEIGQVVK